MLDDLSNVGLIAAGAIALSKPANTLVKKISEAISESFAPWQTGRMTEADAEAKVIHAQADATVALIRKKSDIAVRTMQRLETEEIKKQENMEAIVRSALPNLNPDADPSKIDNDWIVHFFEKAGNISDEEIRIL